jgi:ParB-like chromosome segregation protein Spo0J
MIEKVKISVVKSNPNNPRIIKDNKFKKLVQSIEDFPEMLQLRPIVVNKDNVILGGNMRHKACIDAGLKEVYIIKADKLTEQQQEEFVIKDNSNFGEWDWDLLANQFDTRELIQWGIDVPKFDLDEDTKDLSENIKESFRVEVELDSEEEQEKLYNELIDKGYICRLLTL